MTMTRKMIAALQVSLDGFTQGEDQGEGEWVESWADALQLVPDVDAFVQGAGGEEHLRGRRSHAGDDVARGRAARRAAADRAPAAARPGEAALRGGIEAEAPDARRCEADAGRAVGRDVPDLIRPPCPRQAGADTRRHASTTPSAVAQRSTYARSRSSPRTARIPVTSRIEHAPSTQCVPRLVRVHVVVVRSEGGEELLQRAHAGIDD